MYFCKAYFQVIIYFVYFHSKFHFLHFFFSEAPFVSGDAVL
jgi:hypothetical protein